MSLDETFESEHSATSDIEALVSGHKSERLFNSENIEILNDVDMDITVVIGKAKMKITDLLNLKKGSVIELLQGADEPLQIYANDKPIAKGVIISTNGKYCVRIL